MTAMERYIALLQAAIDKAHDEANANGEYAQGIYKGLRHASRLLSEVMDLTLDDQKNESDSGK